MENRPDAGQWVDDHLTARIPDQSWQPNAICGLERLHSRRDTQGTRRRRALRIAVAAVAACLPLMAIPATRAFAQHCMSACVTQSGRFREFVFGKETTTSPRIVFATPETRTIAPDFTLNDAGGAPLRLSEFRGHVVLLNFWATWCVPCKTEIPWFIDFHRTYKDRGLVVLGVSLDDGGWNQVRPYVDRMKIDYRVMVAGSDVANSDVARLYGGLQAIPVTLIIDKSGRIAVTHLGLCPRSEYVAAIDSLLNE